MVDIDEEQDYTGDTYLDRGLIEEEVFEREEEVLDRKVNREKEVILKPSGGGSTNNGEEEPVGIKRVKRPIVKRLGIISLDTSDVSYEGESRPISISGDTGAQYDLEVYDDANPPNYFNFKTQAWATTRSYLRNAEVGDKNAIVFPANTSAFRTFNIDVYAVLGSEHLDYIEVRTIDGDIDVNNSLGSDCSLARKVVGQDVSKTLYLSCIAPSLGTTVTSTVDGAVSGAANIVIDDTTVSKVNIGDKVSGTGITAASHVLVTVPTVGGGGKTFTVNKNISVGDAVTLTFTSGFTGITPSVSNTSGRASLVAGPGTRSTQGFTITVTAPVGRTLSAVRIPTMGDLCAFNSVTIGAASAISDEDTSASTFFRWAVDNIAGLQPGMRLDPSRTAGGLNTTTPSLINGYSNTINTHVASAGLSEFTSAATRSNYVEPIEPTNVATYDRNKKITAQTGNVVFDTQQAAALASDTSVRIFGYGNKEIQSLTGASVVLKDIVVTPTEITTTTSSAVSNSTTIPVVEVGNISVGSSISGHGVAASAVDPTVTLKSVASGAGSLTASVAQTIGNGQTLFFNGTSNILTITGTIEIINMAIGNTTLYFDLEKFIRIG